MKVSTQSSFSHSGHSENRTCSFYHWGYTDVSECLTLVTHSGNINIVFLQTKMFLYTGVCCTLCSWNSPREAVLMSPNSFALQFKKNCLKNHDWLSLEVSKFTTPNIFSAPMISPSKYSYRNMLTGTKQIWINKIKNKNKWIHPVYPYTHNTFERHHTETFFLESKISTSIILTRKKSQNNHTKRK